MKLFDIERERPRLQRDPIKKMEREQELAVRSDPAAIDKLDLVDAFSRCRHLVHNKVQRRICHCHD